MSNYFTEFRENKQKLYFHEEEQRVNSPWRKQSTGFVLKGVHSQVSKIQKRNIFIFSQIHLLWSLTHATTERENESVYAKFLWIKPLVKISRCLHFSLLIRTEWAPCSGSKGQMWFDCAHRSHGFLMKEAESPLKKMIRFSEQSVAFQLHQSKTTLCLHCLLDSVYFKGAALVPQRIQRHIYLMQFIQKMPLLLLLLILLTAVQRLEVPVS